MPNPPQARNQNPTLFSPVQGRFAVSLAADRGAGSSLWADLPADGEETK